MTACRNLSSTQSTTSGHYNEQLEACVPESSLLVQEEQSNGCQKVHSLHKSMTKFNFKLTLEWDN